ncbi:MAG: GNAT family N-acetyltransferase [Leptonema sp. (in: bacteria)]
MKNQKSIIHYGYIQSLNPFFLPSNVAILYAKEEKISKSILLNLLSNPFGGTIYPVNPNQKSILGIKTYSGLKDIDEDIDLVIITEKYSKVFNCLIECLEKKVKAILLMSTGFREDSSVYQAIKKEILNVLKENQIRLIGPNSFGIISPYTNFNASLIQTKIKSGNIAFISQSGSLGAAILDWFHKKNIGFSSFVSVGSSLDVNLGELIDYFANNSHTKTILIYLESLVNPSSFFSAAREASLSKPIIVLRAGKNKNIQNLIIQRMGHYNEDDLLNTLFRRTGIVRVDTIEELFYIAEALSEQPLPQSNRISIITNAAGPALLSIDEHVKMKGQILDFTEDSKRELRKTLNLNMIQNPLILPADVDEEYYKSSLEIVLKDPNNDGVLVMLTPHATVDPEKIAKAISLVPKNKPVLACWMGGQRVEEGIKILRSSGIPTFEFPDTAIKIFNLMWSYRYSLKGLYETPYLIEDYDINYLEIHKLLNYYEENFKENLEISVSKEDTLKLLMFFGFSYEKKEFLVNPLDNFIILKLYLERDFLFGPIIILESTNKECLQREVELPPLNTTLAKRMLLSTNLSHIFLERQELLKEFENLLVKFSNIVIEFPKFKYFEILFFVNLEKQNLISILDSKLIFYSPNVTQDIKLPIIRPYPKQYMEWITLKDQIEVLIRPIRPEDEPLIIKFHHKLSEKTVYLRYIQSLDLNQRIVHERLIRVCFINYEREIAIVVVNKENTDILGVARLVHYPYNKDSEFSILISDQYQNLGLGTKLLSKLIQIGKKENRKKIIGIILKENISMIRVCQKLNFWITPIDEELVKAEYTIE